jgi:putative membrane protein
MTTRELLLSAWDWEPSIVIGCAALLLIYFVKVQGKTLMHAVYFVSGVLVILVDLVSPIDTLADKYLFSAHMVQHLVLMAVPPLLILGIPESAVIRALGRPWIAKLEDMLSYPALAWLLTIATMAIWHLPILYNAALANEGIHVLQHLTFLITATIFWWLVLCPIKEFRLQPASAVAYLFLACMANTVVAALITFAPVGIYPAYLAPAGDPNLLNLVRNTWGISPRVDQQIGGLLMWVPGCGVYLLATVVIVVHWLSHPDQQDQLAEQRSLLPVARSLKVD